MSRSKGAAVRGLLDACSILSQGHPEGAVSPVKVRSGKGVAYA